MFSSRLCWITRSKWDLLTIALWGKPAFSPGVFRLILTVLTLVYALLLALLLAALSWWGERNWLLSLALFAPPWIFLAPLLILAPLSLLFLRWRLLLVQGGCVALLFFGYMTFRWTPDRPGAPDTLTLVTHNVGQGNRQQFAAFLEREKPDVILLQDAKYRGGAYAHRFPDRYVAARGEFVCISKHLIQQSELLEEPVWNKRPVAARFEILYQGKPLALYNVHLPTPRSQFNRFLSRRVLTDLFGDEESPGGFTSYKSWIAGRIELAEALSRRIASEKLPYIAAGDFNMPDHGYIYHLFAGEMTDAFAKAGRGFGLTFPGESSNPVTFFGPWLRIDFVFAGRGWEPFFCVPESGRKSQHRAVMARLRPLGES